jgi:hypothetical protein
MYETTFSNVTVSQDTITGVRVTQGVLNCTPNSAYNGTHKFTLRRILPCEDAQRRVARLETSLQTNLRGLLRLGRERLPGFIDAATQRFGPSYQGPTSSGSMMTFTRLDIFLHQPWETSLATTEAFWEGWPGYAASDGWIKVREMTTDMALMAQPPFLPARELLKVLDGMEGWARDGMRDVAELRNARQYLDNCRRTHYPPIR